MKHKFLEYAGIRHIQLVLDQKGQYINHVISMLDVHGMLKVLELESDTVPPVPESFNTTQDPGNWEHDLHKKLISGFGRILNITVNNISSHLVVPNTAKLIYGKGGRWVTYWGSPIQPYLYILDVTVE